MVVQRKVTYRLYPSAVQAELLTTWLQLHCRVFNALLEECQRRHKTGEPRLSFALMCKLLTQWRAQVPALAALNAQSLQVTAKRLALAFQAFFRRLKAGETPGFPRFKPSQRFAGWGYKTYGDGWKLLQPVGYAANGQQRHGHRAVRLSGIGEIPLRGRARFEGEPVTAEVLRRGDKWYLSVTMDVAAATLVRPTTGASAAFDWGVKTLLTIARDDGVTEKVGNPRWLQHRLDALRELQCAISVEEIKAKAQLGLRREDPLPKGARLPVSSRLRRMYNQVRALHGKIARQRHDFFHKLSNDLVARFGCLGSETLATDKMVRRPAPRQDEQTGEFLPNGAGREAGRHRNILDAAPAKLLAMVTTKAEEAGSWFALANTLELKPTQRCHCCGALVPKALDERTHRCACGCVCDRDENAARTLLRWLHDGCFWLGTNQSAVRRKETPSIAAQAVWVE